MSKRGFAFVHASPPFLLLPYWLTPYSATRVKSPETSAQCCAKLSFAFENYPLRFGVVVKTNLPIRYQNLVGEMSPTLLISCSVIVNSNQIGRTPHLTPRGKKKEKN